jgi:hypothetical protein
MRLWMVRTGQRTRARAASVSSWLADENGASTKSRFVAAVVSRA